MQELQKQLWILYGWLLGVREEYAADYSIYLNAIERRLSDKHSTKDVEALHFLRKELTNQFFNPRSAAEMQVLEQHVTCLNTLLNTTQLQLQTT